MYVSENVSFGIAIVLVEEQPSFNSRSRGCSILRGVRCSRQAALARCDFMYEVHLYVPYPARPCVPCVGALAWLTSRLVPPRPALVEVSRSPMLRHIFRYARQSPTYLAYPTRGRSIHGGAVQFARCRVRFFAAK